MNVGITCYPTYGGSGIVATELGMELAARGHEVHFITYANPIRLDPDTPRIHYHEVEVSNYPLFQYPPYCLALAGRMAEVAESYNLDILHVHYAIPHSIAAMLAQQMTAPTRRLPYITTLHGTDITLVGVDPSYFGITKFSIEKSDGITSISQNLREQTVETFGVKNEIRVINNFVNCNLYHPDNEKKGAAQYAPNGEKLLIHLSNFRPVKRVLDCIRILAEVRKHVPVRLLMAGDGPERGPAEHLARTLKVDQHVTFLGKQNHVERLIPLAHVLLMPSEMESFGLAALEAMACGVVPVATRVGGVPELITHGEDGFLEAVGDVQAQAARVVELVSDDTLHWRMAKAGRWNAGERFCTDRIIPQYERYYADVVVVMLRYDAAWLLEEYADETPAYPGVPYTLIDAAPDYTIEREPGDFHFQDVLGLCPRLAYDETVVRLVRFTAPTLHVQPCVYSHGVQSNYAMDGEGELRAILRGDYGPRLPPLNDARLSNAIGTSVIVFDREGRPYLPRRAPRQSVFPGGYHCTASGEAVWCPELSFGSLFTASILRELEEEVGLAPEDLDWIRPLAFCREFLRAGKPHFFFSGQTSLAEPALTERRRMAIARQLEAGQQEITDDVAHIVTPADCTIECWANLMLHKPA